MTVSRSHSASKIRLDFQPPCYGSKGRCQRKKKQNVAQPTSELLRTHEASGCDQGGCASETGCGLVVGRMKESPQEQRSSTDHQRQANAPCAARNHARAFNAKLIRSEPREPIRRSERHFEKLPVLSLNDKRQASEQEVRQGRAQVTGRLPGPCRHSPSSERRGFEPRTGHSSTLWKKL